MQTTRILTVLLSLLSLICCSTTRAANIVWVSDNPAFIGFGPPVAGTADDAFTTNILAGHNVIRFNANNDGTILLTPAELAALNTNDLIILGRSMGSGPFGGNQGIQWNTNIYKPMICQGPFLTRTAQLGWFNGSDARNGTPMPLTVVNPNDPEAAYLFAGGTLIGGTNTSGNYDEPLDQNTSQTIDAPVAGGNILALGYGGGVTNKVIVEYPAGTAVRGGTNGGYRLYVASSTREVSGVETAGKENLTPIGEAIFLRAVNLALNNGVAPNLGQTPAITTQPASLAACADLVASLSVTATGQDPLQYQWFFNTSTPVVGGTNATLTFSPLQDIHAGSYEVVISNAVGSITSDVVTVTITSTGVVASAVGNQTVCPGTPVSFSTTATGAGTLQYTWRKGATIVQDPNVLNSSSFSIGSVAATDGGAYSVSVQGDCNTASNNFTLTVIAPVITAQPQNQRAPLGNSATFSVTGGGGGTLSYEWLTNGVIVTGATSATLPFSNIPLAFDGLQVQAIVSNCGGSITSVVATLSVTPVGGISFDFNTPNQFTNAPHYLTYNDWIGRGLPNIAMEGPTNGVAGGGGLDVTGTADMTEMLQAPTFDFSPNGKTLVASIMIKIGAVTQNNRNTQLGFVTATNVFDSATGGTAQGINDVNPQGFMSVILQSTAQPAQTYQLRFQHRGTAGGLAEVTPTPTPTATLTIGSWYKLVATFINSNGVAANTLAIGGSLQDMGPAGNTPGAIVMSFAPSNAVQSTLISQRNMYLAVRTARSDSGADFWDNIYAYSTAGNVAFVAPPVSTSISQGRRAQFRAIVDGEGPYTYQWYSNGIAIPGAGNWKYIAPIARLSDSGTEYSVTVTGPANMVSSAPAVLTVTANPLAVVSVGSADGSTVGLRFNQPVDKATAEDPNNYTIDGQPALKATLRADGETVLLISPTLLTGAFTVTNQNTLDLSGGVISSANFANGVAVNVSSRDIGQANNATVPVGTTYSFAPNSFEVTAGGIDIWNQSDAFRFVYTTKTGDFDVKMRVPYMDQVRTASKAGLQARVSLEPTSPMVMASPNPSFPGRQYFEGSRRDFYNIAATAWGTTRRSAYPEAWLRFRRVANTFTRYSSTNGTDWVNDGQTSIVLPETLYFGIAACSVANGIPMRAEIDNYGDFTGYSGAVITIVAHPATAPTVAAGATVNIVVNATVTGGGAVNSELAYIWQRNDGSGNWTNVAAGSGTYAAGPFNSADNGAQFRAIVSLLGATSQTSAVATVTVTDVAAPTLSAATLPFQSTHQFLLQFSEAMGASATNVANYTVTNNGVVFGIASATFLHGDPRTVVLTTSNILGTGTYTVTVSTNVLDLNNNRSAQTTRTFFQMATPPALATVHEVYQDIVNGTTVANFLDSGLFRSNTPTMFLYSNNFAYNPAINNSQDNYGVKSYTSFVPPTNGVYKFFIRSDDLSQFWMNTNGDYTVLPTSPHSPAAQRAIFAVDGNTATKYLNFDELNTGLTVTPRAGATTVTGLRLTTGNDAPERDPMDFTIEGTTGSPVTGPWTFVASGSIPGMTPQPARTTTIPDVTFANANAYTSYRVIFPTVRNSATANSMQISEVVLLAAGTPVPVHGLTLVAENTAVNANYSVGTTTANSRTNITLVAGQKYYMEMLMKEGGGNDGHSIAFGFTNSAPPANTEILGGTNITYPVNVAPSTPVITEIYTVYPASFGTAPLSGSSFTDLTNALNTTYVVQTLPNLLVAYQKYFATQPFQTNSRIDNYLGRMISYFVAPSNGNYRFYVASDDSSIFFMNTNAVNSTDPAGKVPLVLVPGANNNYTAANSVQNISLVGGQKYFIEGIWKEGGGGDGMKVAVRAQENAGLPTSLEIIPNNLLEFPYSLSRVGPVNLQRIEPVNPVVSDGATISFTAVGVSGFPMAGNNVYNYQWLKNGVPVYVGTPYQNSPLFTTQPLTASDNGAVITLVVSNGFSRVERSTIVTVNSGTPPVLLSAVASQYGNSVTLSFNEVLDQITAGSVENYSISGLSILMATLDYSKTKVTLQTTPQTPNTSYMLTIDSINDVVGNTLNTTTNFTTWAVGGAAVLVEMFTNINGTAVANLTGDPKYIANTPDVVGFVNRFGYDSRIGTVPAATLNGFGPFSGNGLEWYGARISSLFIAPSNGNYRFYISSDDLSEFYMNTNTVNSTDPAGKVLIAQLNISCCASYGVTTSGNNNSQLQVGSINLVGGQAYYMEALFKEGTGGDYFRMAFREAGDPSVPPDTEMASGTFFAPLGNPDANQLFIVSPPPTEITVNENDPYTLSVTAATIPAANLPSVRYTWSRYDSGSMTFVPIPGATGTNINLIGQMIDSENTYRVTLSAPGGATTNLDTLIHIIQDETVPYILSVSSLDGTNIFVQYSESVESGSAVEPSYALYDTNFNPLAVNVIGIYQRADDFSKVHLTLDTQINGDFILEKFDVFDLAATPNYLPVAYGTGSVQNLRAQDIGAAGVLAAGGYNTLPPSYTYTYTNGAFDVSANGWDIWNAADGFHSALREVTGNFDIKVRVQKLTGADEWTKAGLMARVSTNANSRNVFMMTTPATSPTVRAANNLFGFQWRDTDGAASASQNGTSANPPMYPNAWLRLQRSNSVFYGYRSTNGQDWALQAFRDTGSNGAFPETVFVGLATVSHDQNGTLLDTNAYAEYRDLNFPAAPTIVQQPEPLVLSVPIHTDVTFSNLITAGENVLLQWRKDGVAILNETNADLSITNVDVLDSGLYTVIAYNDGGGTISSNILLIVSNELPLAANDSLTATQNTALTIAGTFLTGNDSDPESDPLSIAAVYFPHTIATNFDEGYLAASSVYGIARTNGGALLLTDNSNSISGSLVLNEATPGARVLAFTANFNLRINNGTAQPADGFSFNFGNDLPTGNANATNSNNGPANAENSATATGFAFCVDSYQFAPLNVGGPFGTPTPVGSVATPNTSGMKIVYNGIIIAGVQIPFPWNDAAFIPVSITVTVDGRVTVMVNNTNAFGTRTIPWVPTPGRFGFYARTGGQNQAQTIDDLEINFLAEDTARGGRVSLSGGDVTYLPPTNACGADSFYYLLSDGQFGGTNAALVSVNIVATNGPSITTCVPNQNVSVNGSCAATLPDLRSQLVISDCDTVTIDQTPAPGTSLALGVPVVVTFTVNSTSGFSTNCQATITAVDSTAPVAVCPGNIVAEATSLSGATVSFSISGTDNCSVSSVVANPASGSTFPIGETTVTVTATDGSGNTNACTFTVTVQDTTAPSIVCPSSQVLACTATNGAIATYSASATDAVDPTPTVVFTPPSGSTFPAGTNVVLATTYDFFGNTNTCTFNIVVQDETPASLTITRSDVTNAIVCWPQTCTTYTLESTTNLNPPIAWSPVGLPVDVAGTNYCVTVPIAGAGTNTFFRLHKP